MKFTHYLIPLIIFFVASCSTENKQEESTTVTFNQEKDSLSRMRQKEKGDSMKKLNPLLILPPDSSYSGEYIDKYANGIVKFRGNFRFGERHGQWFSFYPDGKLWSEMHYDKGLRHGPNLTYYENGNIRYSGYYKMDQADSVWTYCDSTGKKVEVLTYKNKNF